MPHVCCWVGRGGSPGWQLTAPPPSPSPPFSSVALVAAGLLLRVRSASADHRQPRSRLPGAKEVGGQEEAQAAQQGGGAGCSKRVLGRGWGVLGVRWAGCWGWPGLGQLGSWVRGTRAQCVQSPWRTSNVRIRVAVYALPCACTQPQSLGCEDPAEHLTGYTGWLQALSPEPGPSRWHDGGPGSRVVGGSPPAWISTSNSSVGVRALRVSRVFVTVPSDAAGAVRALLPAVQRRHGPRRDGPCPEGAAGAAA